MLKIEGNFSHWRAKSAHMVRHLPTGEVEDKLSSLVKMLLPYKENIQVLSTVAYIRINVAYWGYWGQMDGIHFDTEIIQGLASLNLSVDVDLYAGGPALLAEE